MEGENHLRFYPKLAVGKVLFEFSRPEVKSPIVEQQISYFKEIFQFLNLRRITMNDYRQGKIPCSQILSRTPHLIEHKFSATKTSLDKMEFSLKAISDIRQIAEKILFFSPFFPLYLIETICLYVKRQNMKIVIHNLFHLIFHYKIKVWK